MNNFERFFTDVSSGYWWTTVVLVGLLINLASAYLKPPLDRWYEKYVATAQARRARANANYNAEVGLLAVNHGLLLAKGFDEVRWRMLTLVFCLFAFALLTAAALSKQGLSTSSDFSSISHIGVRLLAVFCIIIGLWAHARAMQSSTLLHGARVRILKSLLNSDPASK